MTHSTLNWFATVLLAVYYYWPVERLWVDTQQDDKCSIQEHISERYPWPSHKADCHGVQTCVHGGWSWTVTHVHAQTHRPSSCLQKQSFLWGSGSQAHVCTWNFPTAVEETSVDASGKRHKREKGIKSNMKRRRRENEAALWDGRTGDKSKCNQMKNVISVQLKMIVITICDRATGVQHN